VQGAVSFEPSAIVFEADSGWFMQTRCRRDAAWAEENGLLSPTASTERRTLTLALDRWSQLGAGPDSSEPERLDEWAFAHEAVARLLGLTEETLSVQAIGHVGGARLRIQLSVKGRIIDPSASQPPKFVDAESRPVILSPLASALGNTLSRFANTAQHTRAEQFALIGALKRRRDHLRALANYSSRLRIVLDPHLDSFEVTEPEKFALRWSDDGRNRVSLQLFVQGEAEPLPLGDLDSKAPVIERPGRQAILLDRGTELVARRARELAQVRRDRVGEELLRTPIGLVPDGIDTPRIDFRSTDIASWALNQPGPSLRRSPTAREQSGTQKTKTARDGSY
jgi:hypothetical protein